MSNAKLRYGICSGYINADGEIKIRKSLRVYGEGVVDKEKIKNEIIPRIEKKDIDFPIIIYSYHSLYPPSKTGFAIIEDNRGLRFEPRSPKPGTKSFEWFIDENKNIRKINQNRGK